MAESGKESKKTSAQSCQNNIVSAIICETCSLLLYIVI